MEHKRTRPFHNKVKTGCLTCKIRKVKCDETKPHCSRCTKSGRKCDGYRPTTPAPSLVPCQSPTALFASDAERRSFYYFQTHASKTLGGNFNASFWGRQVLQAALHYRPVRHLVVAIGAAYETYEGRGATEGGAAGMEFALKQCNHSIKQLAVFPAAGNQTPETICCVLTASLLFIYLATLRGHVAEAIQHVQYAVKLLPVLDRAVGQHGGASSSPKFPIPVSELRALILSIYGQLRAMINAAAPKDDTRDILWSDLKPASIFLSLADAHNYIERLFQNTLAFLQSTELNPPTTPTRLTAIVTRHRDLCRALQSSQDALDALEVSLRSSSPSHSPSLISISPPSLNPTSPPHPPKPNPPGTAP